MLHALSDDDGNDDDGGGGGDGEGDADDAHHPLKMPPSHREVRISIWQALALASRPPPSKYLLLLHICHKLPPFTDTLTKIPMASQ